MREPEDDHARPEQGDDHEQRPPRIAPERPAREHHARDQRADCRCAAQDAESRRKWAAPTGRPRSSDCFLHRV